MRVNLLLIFHHIRIRLEHFVNLVNGHSYKDKKSTNTNLAILASHHFSDPFKEPIKYGINIGENANQLGKGNVLVQRLGDIFNRKAYMG